MPLRSGDYVKVGGTIFKFLSGGNIESLYHEEIYQLTIVDGLTQVNNKRYFLEYLEREMGRCHRYGRPLSLIMFDIDHFKKINDTTGTWRATTCCASWRTMRHASGCARKSASRATAARSSPS